MRDLELLRKKIVKKIDRLYLKLSNNNLDDNGREDCYLSGKIKAYEKTINMIDKIIEEDKKKSTEWFKNNRVCEENDIDNPF